MVSKDFEGVYLAVAAERGTPSNVYLRGDFDALRWYPRTPSAFNPILPPRTADILFGEPGSSR